MVQHVVLIHPYRAGLERVGDTNRRVEILGVHSRGEAVGGDVAEADGVSFIFEFGDGTDGTEDFLFHDLHVFADVGEDGWLDEVALVAVPFAADFDLGAFLFASVNVSSGVYLVLMTKRITGNEHTPLCGRTGAATPAGPGRFPSQTGLPLRSFALSP